MWVIKGRTQGRESSWEETGNRGKEKARRRNRKRESIECERYEKETEEKRKDI